MNAVYKLCYVCHAYFIAIIVEYIERKSSNCRVAHCALLFKKIAKNRMKKHKYNRLVRDRIPNILIRENKVFKAFL